MWGACRIVEFDLDIIFIAKDVKQKTPCAIYTIYYKNYLFNFEFTPLMVTTQEQLDSWLELFTLSSHNATCKSI